ncbi:MAG: hypothetical protein ABWY16_21435 [Pedobacter sp.]|uniref:hypothetical protein n=1 Tax=Pedobacter sp. TaxID=1411316 RepID=UPI003392D4F1
MNDEDYLKLQKVQNALLMLRPEKSRKRLEKSFLKIFLNSQDIMLIFQICAKTAYRWRKEKYLKFNRVRGTYLYTWGGILDMIDDRLFGSE